MKKIIKIILFLGMLVSILLSCTLGNEDTDGTGKLVLSFPMTQSRTLLPDISMEAVSYDVNGTGPNGTTFSVTSDQTTVSIDKLDFGEWTVTVDAKNIDGTIIGSGQTTCIVHVGETTAALFPEVAKLTQDIGFVKFTRRLVHTHGVKVGHFWEEVRAVAIAANHPSAVTEHANDATVLPVSFFVHVRLFEQAQEVFSHGLSFGYLFHVRNKAWPGPLFQLI